MPCRDALLELLHERLSLFELGPVSDPVSQSEPVSVPGPESVPVPEPESVPEPRPVPVPEPVPELELALVMALEQLRLHVLLQLQLRRCELLQRVGAVAS